MSTAYSDEETPGMRIAMTAFSLVYYSVLASLVVLLLFRQERILMEIRHIEGCRAISTTSAQFEECWHPKP